MECSDGYYGARCNLPCPIGLFGTQCAGSCQPKCTVEDCDRVNGCPVDDGNSTPKIGSSKENTTQAMKPVAPVKWNTSQRSSIYAARKTTMFSKASTVFLTNEPMKKIGITPKVVIVSGGIITAFLLVLIIREILTCRRSNTKTIKLKTGKKETASKKSSEYVFVQDWNERVKRKKKLKREKINIEQFEETVHRDVDDNSNIRRLPGFENTSQEPKGRRLSNLFNTLRINTRKGQSFTQV